ncbi:MAG: hypothetical protein AB7T19_00655 [Planctomycetota bacterium]
MTSTNTRRSASLVAFALLSTVLSAGCTFYSTARVWNSRVGPAGEPVFYRSATKVGINLFVLLPFLGRTDIQEMVDLMTESIADEDGDVVRIVQAGSENYWYGFSPLTWIVTPVVSSIDVEYRPSATELTKAKAELDEQRTRDQRQVEAMNTEPIAPPDQQAPRR